MTREIPYPVALTELPPTWQEAAARAYPGELRPRLTLYLPAHTMSLLRRGRVPDQALIFTETGLLHLQEETKPEARYVPAKAVLALRHTMILLYGRLDVYLSGDSLHIEYNTVAERFLHQPLREFVAGMYGYRPGSGRDALTQTLLRELEQRTFKFKNGLELYALLPDEALSGYVWQPRITGLLGRVRLPASLLALTENAVLHLSEARAKGAAYGWSISWYPRRRLLAQRIAAATPWQRVQWALGDKTASLTQEALLTPEVAQAWSVLSAPHLRPAGTDAHNDQPNPAPNLPLPRQS